LPRGRRPPLATVPPPRIAPPASASAPSAAPRAPSPANSPPARGRFRWARPPRRAVFIAANSRVDLWQRTRAKSRENRDFPENWTLLPHPGYGILVFSFGAIGAPKKTARAAAVTAREPGPCLIERQDQCPSYRIRPPRAKSARPRRRLPLSATAFAG